jgi:hypothetical protein
MADTEHRVKISGDATSAVKAAADTRRQIDEVITTVEKMGRSVNASSATAQRAFTSEAEAARQLATQLGASESQMRRLSTAQEQFNQRIQAAKGQVANATLALSGFANTMSATGRVSAEAMKGIISNAAGVAFAFGPTGAIVAAVTLAGVAIFNLFDRSRREMEESAKKAEETLQRVKDASNTVLGQQVASDLLFQIAGKERELEQLSAERAAFKQASGIDPVTQLSRSLELAREISALRQQYLAVETAVVSKAREQQRISDAEVQSKRNQLALTEAQRKELERITELSRRANFLADSALRAIEARMAGPKQLGIDEFIAQATRQPALPDAVPAGGLAFEAATDLGPYENLRPVPELLLQVGDALSLVQQRTQKAREEFGALADTVAVGLTGASAQAMDALISGHDVSIKTLKKAFAEPIVMRLKATAIDEFVQAAAAAARLNFAQAAAHLGAAAKATAGAALVARLGGVGGGGGGGGGGSTSAGAARSAQLAGAGRTEAQTVRIEMIVVQKTPDGREISRIRQQIQRLTDRSQPIRVTL